MKKFISLSFLALVSEIVLAQQTTNFNQYFDNNYLFSSAYAGQTENTNIWFHYRNQMLGFQGAPETALFTVDRALPEFKIGMGLQAFKDKINIFKRTGATASFSYQLPLTVDQNLRFGLGMGIISNALDYNNIKANSPEELQAYYNVKPVMTFNGDIGMVYNWKKLDAGFSVTNLLNKKTFGSVDQVSFIQNPVFGMLAKYQFPINESISLEPWVLAKSSQGLPITANTTVLLNWKKHLYVGLTYDTRSAVGGTAGIQYNDFKFGYNYGYPTGALSSVSGGIHEVALSFTIRHKNGSDLEDTIKFVRKERNNSNSSSKAQVVVNNNLAQKDTTVHIVVFKNENGSDAANGGIDLEMLQKVLMGDKLEIEPKINGGKVDEHDINKLAEIEKKKGKSGHPDAFNTIYPMGKADIVIAAYLKYEYAKALQKASQKHGLPTQIIKNEFMYYNSTKEVTSFAEAVEEIKRLKTLNLPEWIYSSIWLYGKQK